VFELVTGGTLRARIATGGALPWREAVSLVIQLARALEAVHAVGLVHRDLKPENILFDAAGRPKLSDFGLVRVASSNDALTKDGRGHGHLRLHGARAGGREPRRGLARRPLQPRRSPLHALTAEKPLGGEGFELVKKLMVEVPRHVRELARDVPPDLDRLVAKLLSKQPEERGEGAAAVALELELDRPAAGPASGRGPLVALAAAALVASAVAVAAVGALVLRGGAPRAGRDGARDDRRLAGRGA